MEEKNYSKVPVFENGLAQPVFKFTDGKTGEKYDPATSSIVRYCVYVESDYDMDGDGKRDLVKAFIQVPRSAVEGNYKAATLYEARPYCAGVQADGYDHMKEVESKEYRKIDFADLDKEVPARIPEGMISAMDLALKADPADWYYPDKGNNNSMVYENLDNFNYYLVRGFAVVVSAGFGALGSDGFNYVGSEYERDAFKSVVEWLHGDRVAYADREGKIETKADWANGNVAMTGRSYAGTMPFAVATTGVEGLKTIVPVAGIADWYTQQNMQGAQRYWPKEMLNSFLAYFCSSRYNDETLSEKQLDDIAAFHHELSLQQLKCGFDYDPEFWGAGNYRLHADQIKCSALIVHGFNDENVSTKQFEMMHTAFEQAGQTVKLILHQGPHITPTMANKNYGILIDGKFYDDIVNEWISHYLYGVENGAEKMPEVLAQTNYDQKKWETESAWETEYTMKLTSKEESKTVIDTDWEKAGVSAENFDDVMALNSTNMAQRYVTDPFEKAVTVQGTVCLNLKAALKDGNIETDFDPENRNDVDTLTMQLGNSKVSGKMDDVEIAVLLCDVCDEEFDSIQTVDPERNIVPVTTVKEGGIMNGGDLPAFDEAEFNTVHKKYRVITRAFADLCNPEAGYAPETAQNSIELKKGEYHDYTVYLNATRYTVEPGHRLAVVVATEDPVNCLIHKTYSVEIDDNSVMVEVPVTKASEDMGLNKAE
ncbi:Xaa-Pro dipeptidyl-peptidase [Dorea longicatena]|uniref:Xaa-Pro dipeptidyl-peptidase n=1 Tax=Dorea longicatena TaxID=88431 RepID=A0A173YEJ9_9FIRM|nr:CocE/NonD family hydrolase [Dorea longicatena]CUN61970.1 Xaa-Pro dipeptidyl-peptidase [Dorea longicatena]